MFVHTFFMEAPATDRYHHPELRQALLDKALEILRSEGVKGLTIRKLATHCGVSHAAPYRHFSNKDEIIATLLLQGHVRLEALLRRAAKDAGPRGRDRLAALGRAYLSFARSHATHLRLMFSRESLQSVVNIGPKAGKALEGSGLGELGSFGPLLQTVRQCQEEGSLPLRQDAEVTAMAIWSQIHGLALLYNEGLVEEMSRNWSRDPDRVMEGILSLMDADGR